MHSVPHNDGAPDFKQGADKDAVVLDVREKNIDKTMPDYAYNPLAQTPYTMYSSMRM